MQDTNRDFESGVQTHVNPSMQTSHRGHPHQQSMTFSAGSTQALPLPHAGPLPIASEMPNQPFLSQETPQNEVPPNSLMTGERNHGSVSNLMNQGYKPSTI